MFQCIYVYDIYAPMHLFIHSLGGATVQTRNGSGSIAYLDCRLENEDFGLRAGPKVVFGQVLTS